MSSQTQRRINKQKEQDRARLRREQRELARFIQKEQKSIADFNSDVADKAFAQIQAQNDQVGTTREACIDSEVFRGLSNYTSKQAVQLGVDGAAISWKGFLSKLREACGSDGRSMDWQTLGESVSVFFSSPTPFSFMMGPLSIEKKVRQASQRLKKNNYVAEKPLTITHDSEKKKKKTEHETFQKLMCDTLMEEKSIDMFKFLVNPESFTQTVENIFGLSFLVKDGWSTISWNKEKDVPVLKYRNANVDKSEGALERQCIISFTMADFERIKEVQNISEPVLPHREDKEYDKERAGNDSDYEVEQDADPNEQNNEEQEEHSPKPTKRKKPDSSSTKKQRKRTKS